MLTISRATENAIYATWDYIASDAYDMCDGDNSIALELVLDANRLTMNGYAEADAELKSLYEKFGWEKVFKTLSKKFRLL
jgi:hypothetical protein